MLSPNYLKNCTEDIVRLYQGLEDDIIRDIARKQKYDLIVQEAVYVGPNVDITDDVIKALGSGKK